MDKVDNPPGAQLLCRCGPVLGIFAKQPRAGRVKTRLSPPLTPREARLLYDISLRESVARFAAEPFQTVVCWSGRRGWFGRAFPGLPLLWQGRGDLGARLARVTAALFAAGGGPVAVAGSDSPDLPPALVAAAFAALAHAEVAAVASLDGGYAVLALRRPVPELFAAMPWSTDRLLARTRDRAETLGLRFETVGAWDDLDDLPALRRLLERSPQCATARHLRARFGNRLCAGCG